MIYASRRLVQQKQTRLARECARDLQPPLIDERQLIGLHVQFRGHAHEVEHLASFGPRRAFSAANAEELRGISEQSAIDAVVADRS